MKLNKTEQNFLKGNKKILRSLFNKRIEDLKENVFSMDIDDRERRDLEIRFIQEMKMWLQTLDILEAPKQKEDQNFI